MKSGARYIALASGPIANRKRTILIGLIFREGYLEGVLSAPIDVDGSDSTSKIIKMISRSRFKEQIRVVMSNGIALAGLNVMDPSLIERKLGVKTLLMNRRRQNPKELANALKEFSRMTGKDVDERIEIIRGYGIKPVMARGMHVQSSMDRRSIGIFAERAFEALRMAHIITSGLSSGESKGRV